MEKVVSFYILFQISGSLPGAIIFGLLLDSSCILWNEECGVRGQCHLYDRVKASVYIVLFGIGMKIVAIACFIVMLVTYKPRYAAHGASSGANKSEANKSES